MALESAARLDFSRVYPYMEYDLESQKAALRHTRTLFMGHIEDIPYE